MNKNRERTEQLKQTILKWQVSQYIEASYDRFIENREQRKFSELIERGIIVQCQERQGHT